MGQYRLARCYRSGTAVRKNNLKSIRAVSAGGATVIPPYQIAVQLFQRAADRRFAKAQYSLGICYPGQVGVLRCYQGT